MRGNLINALKLFANQQFDLSKKCYNERRLNKAKKRWRHQNGGRRSSRRLFEVSYWQLFGMEQVVRRMSERFTSKSVEQIGLGRCRMWSGKMERKAGGNTRRQTRRSSSFCGTALTCASQVCLCARLFCAEKSSVWASYLDKFQITDGLRRFIMVNHHVAVHGVEECCEAEVYQLTLPAEKECMLRTLIDTTDVGDSRWQPPFMDARAFSKEVEGAEWETMFYNYKEAEDSNNTQNNVGSPGNPLAKPDGCWQTHCNAHSKNVDHRSERCVMSLGNVSGVRGVWLVSGSMYELHVPDIISSCDEESEHNVLNLFLDVVAPGHASGKFRRRLASTALSCHLSMDFLCRDASCLAV